MGQDLLTDEPDFAEGLREFDRYFQPLSGWSVEAWLTQNGDLTPAFRAYPCILGVSFGLTTFLRANACLPDVCLGHSGGEVAAAWAAGALSTQQAAGIASAHAKILQSAAGSGAMLHLALSEEEVVALLATTGGRAQIAAYNAPRSFVVSAEDSCDLEALVAAAEASHPDSTRFLSVDVPFHAREIARLLPDFADLLAGLQPGLAPQQPDTPLISALHGGVVDVLNNGDLGEKYWLRHIHEPVRFDRAVDTALKMDVRHFVEVSPHAILQDALNACAAARQIVVESTACMVRKTDGRQSVRDALAVIQSWREPSAVGAKRGGLTEKGARFSLLDTRARQNSLLELLYATLTDIGLEGKGVAADTIFQAVGLTSLLSMRLAASLSNALGLPLPVSAIFSNPTPERLARHLAERLGALQGEQSAQSIAAADGGRSLIDVDEPIAVVGAACRLPGGIVDLESYWNFIAEGRDAVIPIPKDRWDWQRYYDPDREAPGKMHTREAAFLTTPLDRFDSFFFNISAKEAKQLDPQQRLLLELAWQAFEHAGINPDSWRGENVGVFIGLTNSEYSHAHRDSYRRELIDAYSLTGTTSSGACGRISYFFGFEGPCWSVDTACSSGIVALHNACKSLSRGESQLALVGAATLMLTPDLHICFTKLGAVSTDGRSKAFDDGANGYGRGEGGVMLLLKRLSDAERDGDRILGLIRGSAINQDGRSNGLTAPNGEAQQKVIRQALRDAGRSPLDVSYVEAHGTGTALGDAIELDALAAAYCADRSRTDPLYIGSVKANIGHLEPAAALASLLKVLLCFEHGAIPGNIHIKTPNRRFDFTANAVEAPRTLTSWRAASTGVPRCAGLSAFGFSGVNGHIVVEEYQPPPVPLSEVSPPGILFLPLSAKTPAALLELSAAAGKSLEYLDQATAAAFCREMATARPIFSERRYVSAETPAALAAALADDVVRVEGVSGDPVLLFTGQGSQYPDMGRALYATYPVFRAALDESFRILAEYGIDGHKLLFGGTDAETLADTALAQPLIAAVSHALWRLWESFGLRFKAVSGHSIGEYPAAVAAGVMSLEDMLKLATARGRAMREAPEGAMAAVFAKAEEIAPLLEKYPGVVIAAFNAPTSLTLSGAPSELDTLLQELAQLGKTAKHLHVSRAFHSPSMLAAAEQFAAAFADVSLHPPTRMAFVSSVDGRVDSEEIVKPEYWVRQITRPVHFVQALSTLAGFSRLAVEAGPSASLSGLVEANAIDMRAVPTQAPGQHGLHSLFAAVGRLFQMGVALDFAAVFQPFPHAHVPTPTYPFQRESYWMPVINDPPVAITSAASGAGTRQFSPALGDSALFVSVFDGNAPHFVQEHVIFDQAISPAAGHMAMLLAAARDLWGEVPCELSNVDFLAPLVVVSDHPRLVQIIIESWRTEALCPFKLVSVTLDEQGTPTAEDWQTHCTGFVSTTQVTPLPADDPAVRDLEPPADFGEEMTPEAFYRCFVKRGYAIGEGFQQIKSIRHGENSACCRVGIRGGDGEGGHVIYPGALDSILQTILPPGMLELDRLMQAEDSLFIPMHVERLTLWAPLPEAGLCFSRIQRTEGDRVITGGVVVRTTGGQAVLELGDCLFRMTDYGVLYRNLHASPTRLLYTQIWQEVAPKTLREGEEATAEIFVLPLGGSVLPAPLATLPRLDASGLTAFFVERKADATPPRLLVLRTQAEAGEGQEQVEQDVVALLHILQQAAHVEGEIRLSLALAEGEAAAALRGLAASFALEHPDVLGAVLDLPSAPTDKDYALLLRYCRSGARGEYALRDDGKSFTVKLSAVTEKSKLVEPDFSGAHLITGGTGALGIETARWLAKQGATRVALLSRSGALPQAAAKLGDELRDLGCELLLCRGDVTSENDVAAVLARLRTEGPPLRGVFHAAGLLDDGLCVDLNAERLARVQRPKVQGALLLDRLTRQDELAFFVCFSSAGSLIGSQGQANYNAANHFLNALCRRRQAEGLPAAAPCFGPWEDGGMADNPRVRQNLTQQGIMPLSSEDALQGLAHALAAGLTVFGVMDMDWDRFVARRGVSGNDPFSLLVRRNQESAASPERATQDFPEGTRDANGVLQADKVLAGLRRITARLLGQQDAMRIAPDTPLADYGFDSLMAVEFRTQVGNALQMRVPLSITFEFPTLGRISAWLCAQSAAQTAAPQAAAAQIAAPPAAEESLDVLRDIDALLGDDA
ncbi:hypothetical protein FACS1894116_10420 [Betaproteobacteria bacterium]|nr:hypothetical protein FACS1894116_10420 [Betaproteobacteria bacterium]GHU27428.1 hypothetical protein FACS189497_00610 [Betaproteobacteria bacterium]